MSGMRKTKILECTSCGCARKMFVTPTVTKQDGENKFIESWKRVCINCFVRHILNSAHGFNIKLEGSDKLLALGCVESEEP